MIGIVGGMGAGARRYRFRAELRQRRLAWVGVAVIIGLSAGLVLALVAGARRTDSAVGRFVEDVDAHELLVISGLEGTFDFAEIDLDEVDRLPGVEEAIRTPVLAVSGRTADDRLVDSSTINFIVDPTGRVGVERSRFKILSGRLADPDEPNEVVVAFRTAEAFDLEVGDTLDLNFLEEEELGRLFGGESTFEELSTAGPLEAMPVVGIIVEAGALAPPAPDDTTDVWLTPAGFDRYGSSSIVQTALVHLEAGPEGIPAFQDELERLGGGQPVLTVSTSSDAAAADRGVTPFVRALYLTALLLVVVTVFVAGQVLARQASAESGDDPALRALGWTTRDLLRLRVAKAAVIGVGAAAVALVFSIALSPLFPLGLARIVEPGAGVDVDPTVTAVGVIGVLLMATGLAAGMGLRQLRAAVVRPIRRPSRIVAALGAGGAPPPITVGTSLAVQGGPGGSVGPLVSAGTTIALGLGTVAAVVAFMASLGHLTETPRLYGWNWDVELGQEFAQELDEADLTILREDPDVRALAAGTVVELAIGDERLGAFAVDDLVGTIEPSMIRGRPASGDDEIVVAPGTADVGEEVVVTVAGAEASFAVVGHAVVPRGEAMLTFAGLRRIAPDTSTQTALVDLRAGADVDGFIRRISPALSFTGQDVSTPNLPDDLVNFGRVDSAPAAIAGAMGLVAVMTLIHALVTTVRRRRKELAVLRALGLTRRQVLGTVAWQAGVLVVVAVLVAIPAGVAAGRWGWIIFARELKVVAAPVVPVLALLAGGLAAVVLAVVVALLAGRWSIHRSAAAALRAE